MSETSAPPLTIRQPGEGASGDLVPGLGVVWKLDTEHTNGMVSVVEHPFAVGTLVPPHIHHREDEYSIVTEGRIGFRSGDRETVLGAGGYITKPRDEVHAMWNAGEVPARMIEIISPGGFEGFSVNWPPSSRKGRLRKKPESTSANATASSSPTPPGYPTSSSATSSTRCPADPSRQPIPSRATTGPCTNVIADPWIR